MLSYRFILDLAIILLSTKVLGVVTKKFHLPQIIGAIIAGLLLGPVVFGVFDGDTNHFFRQLAELGVIAIMFTAGLGADVKKLKHSGKASIIIAAFGVIIPLIGGFAVASLFNGGFSNIDTSTLLQNIFIGVILTATSVSITVETLQEMGKLGTRSGTVILGAALIDDIFGIIILSIVIGVADSSVHVTTVVFKIVLFFILAIGIALLFNKLFGEYTKTQKERRRFTIISFAFCLIMAFVAEEIFGVADIAGAFIAGLAISTTKHAKYLKRRFEILSYMLLSPIFFASIGLSIIITDMNFKIVIFSFVLVLIAISSKIIGCNVGARLSRFSKKESMQIAIGMIARAEVALIIANKGSQIIIEKGSDISSKIPLLLPEFFTPIVFMVIVTAIATPVLLKFIYSTRKTEEIVCVDEVEIEPDPDDHDIL